MSKLQNLENLIHDASTRDEDVMFGLRNQRVSIPDRRDRWKTLKNINVFYIRWDSKVEVWCGEIQRKTESHDKAMLDWYPVMLKPDDTEWRPADMLPAYHASGGFKCKLEGRLKMALFFTMVASVFIGCDALKINLTVEQMHWALFGLILCGFVVVYWDMWEVMQRLNQLNVISWKLSELDKLPSIEEGLHLISRKLDALSDSPEFR